LNKSIDECPYCGSPLTGWSCWRCNADFVLRDGELAEKPPIRDSGSQRRCVGCELPLDGRSEHVAEWEDGDNADSYIRCARCGAENV
jgi:DNA-directed RNA polymerase subunit RPC12/RpoP